MIISNKTDKLKAFWLLENYPDLYRKNIKKLQRKKIVGDVHIFVDEKKELFFNRVSDLCQIHVLKEASRYGSGYSFRRVCDISNKPFFFLHGSIFLSDTSLIKINNDITTVFSGLIGPKDSIGLIKNKKKELMFFTKKSLEKWSQFAFISSQSIQIIKEVPEPYLRNMYSFELFNFLLKKNIPIKVDQLKRPAVDTGHYKYHKTLLSELK